MKIYLRNEKHFHPQTIEFYKSFADIVSLEDAEIIIINDFEEIETDKIVACNSTGLDHIKAPEIISLRGEDLSDFTAVPELCLGMAITLMRSFKGEEIRGKTLGIIGYGRIGKIFDKYAGSLGMKVLRYESDMSKVFDGGITSEGFYTLEGVLQNSDIVSIHITADENNRGYFDDEKFGKMKQGAILLNSSRPWLVDEEALKWALDNKLSCAWFDFDMPFSHDNLRTTPHLGGTTRESKQKSELLIANKIKRLYAN